MGTLIEPCPAVAAAYAAAGQRFGSSLAEAEIETRFRRAWARREAIDAAGEVTQEGIHGALLAGGAGQAFQERNSALPPGGASEAGEQARWRAIVGEVFDDVVDPDPLFQALWRHFAQPQHWRLVDGATEAWRRLAAQGLVLGVASNFDARLEAVCGGLAPLSGCRLFISSRLGHRKPSPAFFRAIELALGLRPEQLLLVGDDRVNDYEGALAAGWQAVLVDPLDRFEGVRRVRSLAELADSSWVIGS